MGASASANVSLKESQEKVSKDAPLTENEIVTTAEEMEGYFAVKSCLNGLVDLARVAHRDQKSFFRILLDDNNRKPIARLHFNGRTKYIGIFDKEKNEVRHPVTRVDDIYAFADQLRQTVSGYVANGG